MPKSPVRLSHFEHSTQCLRFIHTGTVLYNRHIGKIMFTHTYRTMIAHIDGLMQGRRYSFANALESRLSCTNASICCHWAIASIKALYRDNSIWTQIAKFMEPPWGPPGACRPQMDPCWPHEHCYQGIYWGLVTHICVNELRHQWSGNRLSPVHHHTITYTNNHIIITDPTVTDFGDNW